MIPKLEPLGFVHTGDGKFFVRIGDKVRCPDFVNTKEKKIVEIWGRYWHRNDVPQELINWYKQAGWDCQVIWEDEI